MFIYGPETRTPGGLGAHFARMNPNEKYMGHFINLIALDELARKYATHKGTARQIEKEMEICRRKLRWWSARPGFSRDLITVLSKTARVAAKRTAEEAMKRAA